MSTTWIVLAVLSGISLAVFFGGRNAVWGGLTLGAVLGVLVAGGIAVFTSAGFEWTTVVKWSICAVLWGTISETHGRWEASRSRK